VWILDCCYFFDLVMGIVLLMISPGLVHPSCGNIWLLLISVSVNFQDRLNELMESKGGKKKSSSSRSLCYEAPLGYSIEDIRPAGGIKKFRSAAYSNVSCMLLDVNDSWVFFAHE
jgi:hypothetical protein